MADICISYRRADSQAITGRIFDRLIAHYGKDSIFIDIDNIPAGTDFRQFLSKTLLKATVLLAIVGPKWLGPAKGSPDRIHDETDPVRVEVETALRGGVVIIPVLIGNRKMPTVAQVPPSLRDFVFVNAVTVDPGVDFDHHIHRLISQIDAVLSAQGKASVRAPAVDAPPARRSPVSTATTRSSSEHRISQERAASAERRVARTVGAAPARVAVAAPPSAVDKARPTGTLFGRFRWLPFAAGAVVLALALLAWALVAMNGQDAAPSSSLPRGAKAEAPVQPSSSGKCSVQGVQLDLRNCR